MGILEPPGLQHSSGGGGGGGVDAVHRHHDVSVLNKSRGILEPGLEYGRVPYIGARAGWWRRPSNPGPAGGKTGAARGKGLAHLPAQTMVLGRLVSFYSTRRTG